MLAVPGLCPYTLAFADGPTSRESTIPIHQDQLDRFRHWFDAYAGGFYGDDAYINANLQLKQEHTHRTRAEMVLLAGELGLDDDETRIAELIGLLHDVGRFPQFAQYRTYNDPRSVNHCRLGVQVLRAEGVLDVLSSQERRWVETAVGLHGRKCLPSALNGRALLLAKLIRDADKIDIFRIVVENYRQYREDPEGFLLEIELPDVPEYSPEVLEAIMNEQLVDSARLRTLNDAKLCQLGWVYDLNFTASLRRIEQCHFLPELFSFLPQTDEIRRLCEKIRNDVDARLASAP